MARNRPPYPAVFRRQIVKVAPTGPIRAGFVRMNGPAAHGARVEGAGVPVSDSWRTERRERLSDAEREELARLRREIKRLREDCDILVEATVWSRKPTADAGA